MRSARAVHILQGVQVRQERREAHHDAERVLLREALDGLGSRLHRRAAVALDGQE